jgi:bromodomain-containing factor 1
VSELGAPNLNIYSYLQLGQIAEIEQQLEVLQSQLSTLKNRPVKKKKEDRRDKAPVASTSKAPPKQSKSQPSKKKSKKPIADDDVLTFEQKKDLSESIGKLDGAKLEKVIQIIHEGVPEIRDVSAPNSWVATRPAAISHTVHFSQSTEEIELEIDTLPAAVLTKLYNFVIRPLRAQPTKRNRTGKGTGTGGLKRKSMDEDVEAEKIRQLEQRMALFDQPLGSATAPVTRNVDSDHSSDSSDSDSSGSDSE